MELGIYMFPMKQVRRSRVELVFPGDDNSLQLTATDSGEKRTKHSAQAYLDSIHNLPVDRLTSVVAPFTP